MPRAGSTLLQNLLAQNPNFYCTATNDLLDLICTCRDKWMTLPGFIAQGLKKIESRVKGFLRNAIYGFYEEEFVNNKVVFDKSRGHLANIELLEDILERKIRVIVPVRDIRDIVASFEKIYRRSSLTDHPVQGAEVFRRLTVRGRAERLCSIDHTIGYVANTLQDVFERGLDDRLIIVPYQELTHNPIDSIARICSSCNLPTFTCDPKNIQQLTHEDDTVYGMSLHEVSSVVEPDQGNSWEGVIPKDLAEALIQRFQFIQQLANQRFLHVY